jgi:hypothetical protein
MTSDRAEHPLEDLLDRATTALRDAPIPGGPSADLVASTVRTLQALDHQPDLVRPRQRKNLMFRIVRYSSLAAALVLIAVAVGWLFVMDRTAATSLAAVVEQVSHTRSVSFQQTTTEGASTTTEKVVVLAEGLARTESPGGEYTILDIRQGKSMSVSPSQKQARVLLGFNAQARRTVGQPGQPSIAGTHARRVPPPRGKRGGLRNMVFRGGRRRYGPGLGQRHGDHRDHGRGTQHTARRRGALPADMPREQLRGYATRDGGESLESQR